jgi:N-methylhydantoinase B
VAGSGRPIGEYLQQSAEGATQCTWCATIVSGAETPWKHAAAEVRSPVGKAGSHRSTDLDFWLVEHCCPTCATLLDTEVVWRDDPPLHDAPKSWPGA